MNVYQMLGHSIAQSVDSVGTAFRVFAARGSQGTARHPAAAGWLEQFSPASLDQRAQRLTVDALYRGATVRI